MLGFVDQTKVLVVCNCTAQVVLSLDPVNCEPPRGVPTRYLVPCNNNAGLTVPKGQIRARMVGIVEMMEWTSKRPVDLYWLATALTAIAWTEGGGCFCTTFFRICRCRRLQSFWQRLSISCTMHWNPLEKVLFVKVNNNFNCSRIWSIRYSNHRL